MGLYYVLVVGYGVRGVVRVEAKNADEAKRKAIQEIRVKLGNNSFPKAVEVGLVTQKR